MLPPSKSEYEQEDHNLDAQSLTDESGKTDHETDASLDDVDLDADLDPGADDLGDDLENAAEEKPKKKGIGKGTIIAAVGATIVVALCGAAYVMQGQLKTPAPVTKKVVTDPSLLANKPATPMEPMVSQQPAPGNTPNATIPSVQASPSLSAITAPPSDPFGGVTTAPTAAASVPTPAPIVVQAPVAAVVPPVIAPPVKSVAIAPVPTMDGPRGDPFGSSVVEKPAKIEKPIVEKAAKPVTEPIVKAEKPIKVVKAKPAPIDIDEVEMVQPRAVMKASVKKPRAVRQDMTVSEPHPSQERVKPQSSETFHGYEKLF